MEQADRYAMELRGLTLGYGRRVLIECADAGFSCGEFTALIGRNGTGKSTLLRAMAGLMKPLSGEVTVNGRALAAMSPAEAARSIAVVSTDQVRVTNLRAGDVVALGRAPYTGWIGTLGDDDRARVRESLRLVGMEDFSGAAMDTLSDGERQRVMIARALAQDTPVILLDEPTAFLDLANRYEICLLLHTLARDRGKCVVFSTHDLGMATELADRMAIVEGSRLWCGAVDEMVGGGALQRVFAGTRVFFDAATHSVKVRK